MYFSIDHYIVIPIFKFRDTEFDEILFFERLYNFSLVIDDHEILLGVNKKIELQ